MPALSSVTLMDGASTPVSHVFTPAVIDDKGVARYRESDGLWLNNKELGLSFRQGTRLRMRQTLSVPTVVTETINGVQVPKVARMAYATVEFTFDLSSTSQERKDIARMVASLNGGNATFDSVLVDLEGIY